MQHGQNRGFETGDIAALRHFVDVKVVGQGTEGDAGSRHLGSIAPGESDDALLPPGRTVRKGAITLISNLDRLASPRRAGDSWSRPKPRSGGAERASLDAVQLLQIPNHPKATMDGANVIADCDNVGTRTAEGRLPRSRDGERGHPRPGEARKGEAPAVAGLYGSDIHRAMA